MARLELRMLGPLLVLLDGNPITSFETVKVRGLLALLAADAFRPQFRESLAELLWPDWPQQSAMSNLRHTLANLRKNLGDQGARPPFLIITRESIQLNPDSDVWVDTLVLNQAVSQANIGESLCAVDGLYRGPFLEGFSLAEAQEFSEWLLSKRAYYNQQVLSVLDRCVKKSQETGEYTQALALARRGLTIESWREESHQQVMYLLALSGQRSAALAQYEECKRLLQKDLGVSPSAETNQLFVSIRTGSIVGKTNRQPDVPVEIVPTSNDRHHNLPVQLTRFIGREHDIPQVKKWLIDNRLVTLTGPGGCGKTRLALQIASDLLPAYEHGVWMVEFAPLNDPEFITQAVAAAIGVREYPGVDLSQAVFEYLSSRHVLLVFDNCEHMVTDIARFVDNILRTCPNLSIMVTSREQLGVSGEAIWTVPSLSLPIQKPWTDPANAQEAVNSYLKSEAVQLFMARASAVSSEMTLTIENGAWVAEICRRLDGMPLAIELAAARVRALSVKQIAERLDDRFNLLTGGNRTAPLRQQTLAAALDWSYTLLSEPERRVLQRLSIFAGGAALEAVEAVCICESVQREEVLDVLSHLVEKSLVVADQSSSETRYRLLETIRQYARQKLVEQGDEDDCRDCHLQHFMNWAETIEPTLHGKDRLVGVERYEIEHDNLRAALEWSSLHGNTAKAGLQLATACGIFWRLHSHFSEGRRRFSSALSPKLVQDRSGLHARALNYSATFAYYQGDYPAAQPMLEESITICRELGQEGRKMLGQTLMLLGDLKNEVGDYSGALPVFHEALQIFSQLNDKKDIGGIHMQLGWEAMRTGDYPQAQDHLEKYLTLSHEIGDKDGLIYALSGLGEIAVRLGQVDRASGLLKKSLSLSRDQGDKWGEATILGSLGWIALRQHDFDLMRELLNDSLALRMDIGDQGGIAWCLEKLAELAFREGEYQKAVIIFGSAASLRIPIHSVIDQVDLPDYERFLVDLHLKLDQKTFTACWDEGEAMHLRDVVIYALSKPIMPIDETTIFDKAKFQGLSKRELQTAALVAQGKSNREIAQVMTIGEKTVETYVTRILNKLGFGSRVQIATWAVERGLLSSQK